MLGMSAFSTPVLLIAFNRPNHTRRVIEAIRYVRPVELFVFQDGARNQGDDDRCMEVRSAIREMVDWPCQLHTFFSAHNLGCGPGPVAAISWFFNHVEKGIILEDDVVPHPDFFGYASFLLEKYGEDESVMAIGSMKLGNEVYGDGSYYFSKMNHTLCAWATWKRAWERFDYTLSDFSVKELDGCLKSYGACLREREYWCERLEEIHKDCLGDSSWDQQFWMSIWRFGGKGILPNVNLCSNIGFDRNATHTTDASNPAANNKTERILPMTAPSSEEIQIKADDYFQRHYFQPWAYGWEGFKNLPFRINKRIKKWVGHEGPWFNMK